MKKNIKKLTNFNEFCRIFKVFEGFPFFEKWTEEEIRQEFDNNLKNGHIFGYYENDECLGFISMRNQHPNEHPVHYGHESKVVYLSDLAVLPQHRRHGIATKLLEHALTVAVSESYDYVYLRINENNPMAFDIAKKQGFKRDYNSCEEVKSKSGKKTEEFRIFMYKKLF